MEPLNFEQELKQLAPQKGSYCFLALQAATVDGWPRRRATRLICVIDDKVQLPCGLNHLGDGNYFIIVAGRYLKMLGKKAGDKVRFSIAEDPNPLGVDIPEVLAVLLDQDEALQAIFDSWTDGKKRTMIYAIKDIKDIDRQVQQAIKLLQTPATARATRRF